MQTVTLSIQGDAWRYWEQVSIALSLDTYSTITFTGAFDPSRLDMRRTFKPFSFHPLTVDVGSGREAERAFTGTMVGVVPKTDGGANSIEASGYALPGVLGDVTPDPTVYPLQCDGLNLRQIADKFCGPLGVTVVFDPPNPGPRFRKIAIEPTAKIWDFLADIAQQQGRILRDKPDGSLLFAAAPAGGETVAKLREGSAPMLSCVPTFSPQQYYSEITGLAPTKSGRKGARFTQRNARASGIVRPFSFTAEDADRGDLPSATAAKMGRMFGNMVSYVAAVPTWRNESGGLWKPGQTVSVYAPGAMIFRPYKLLIRDVKLDQNAVSESASLGLVLPGAFSGETPVLLPWE